MRARNAFTLVELLVVITIITILVSLLLPALKQSIEAARAIACANNLKQTAIYLRLYEDEFRDFHPYGWHRNIGWNYPDMKGRSWADALYVAGYIEDVKNISYNKGSDARLYCPSVGGGPYLTYGVPSVNMPYNSGQVPMGSNHHPFSSGSGSKFNWVNMRRVLQPSRTVNIMEIKFKMPEWYLRSIQNVSGSNSATTPYTPGEDKLGRHAGGSNVLYADTHVQRREIDYFITDMPLKGTTWCTIKGVPTARY